MRRIFGLFLVAALALSAPALAKDPVTKFKTAEAKHFPRAEGVELSPEFSDYLYAELRNELGKTKLFALVIGEGEVVEDADAPASIVVEGTITEYKKGSVVKDVLIGFTAGWRSLRVETRITRRSDHATLQTLQSHVRTSPRWNEKVMARTVAKQIAKEIKKSLEHSPNGS